MGKETEAAVQTGAVADGVHVVGVCISDKCGNRGVDVTSEENHQHVIDEIINVEEVLISWIGSAVDIQALNFEIISVADKTVGGSHPKPGPGIHIAIGGKDGVAGSGIDLNYIVVFFVPAKVGRSVRGLWALG